jgi:hypothetical protein
MIRSQLSSYQCLSPCHIPTDALLRTARNMEETNIAEWRETISSSHLWCTTGVSTPISDE